MSLFQKRATRSLFASVCLLVGMFAFSACKQDNHSHDHIGSKKKKGHKDNDHKGHPYDDHKGHKHNDHKGHKHDDHDDHKGHKHEDHAPHKGHDKHKGHKHNGPEDGQGHKDHKDDKHKGHDHEEHDVHKGEVKLNPAARKEVHITTYQVKEEHVASWQVAAVGRVLLPPSKISRVGSRVEGRIVRWYVKLGQRVRRGQALALLDSPAVGRARAEYLRNRALYKLTTIEFKRAKRLKRIGLTSAKKLLAAQMTMQRAEINFRSARAQLRILGVSLPSKKRLEKLTGRYVLPAPSAGEVTEISKTLGAWVHPQATILRVENRKKVWVLLEVYARDVPYVKVGQSVHLYGPGIHNHLVGKISYLASRFEQGAQTLEARVVLKNKNGRLRPNQFMYALIDGPKKKRAKKGGKVILIPEDAVQRLGQRKVVFVLGEKPGHYGVRTVVTVEAPKGQMRVLYGLKTGERIVVKGSFVLKSELMRESLEGGHGHAH